MPGHTGTRTLALQNAERSHGSRRGVRKHCEKFRSQDFEGCWTPAVVAMTVNMLRRVPAGIEQPSRSVPVRFFVDRIKIAQLPGGSAGRSGALRQPFTSGSHLAPTGTFRCFRRHGRRRHRRMPGLYAHCSLLLRLTPDYPVRWRMFPESSVYLASVRA